MVTVHPADYEDWRRQARRLLAARVPPADVAWLSGSAGQSPLPFGEDRDRAPAAPHAISLTRVPRAFVRLAETAACHRSAGKWALLYRVLWRLGTEGPHVLGLDTDPEVQALSDMAAAVRRDEHKMRAFVRFTPVIDGEGARYVAWYEPDHLILHRAAPFFADRFASLRWSILTPDLSAHWDLETVSYADGVPAPAAQETNAIEDLWRVYYAAVFNPARANLRATLREMPLRRWRTLPEARLIPSLLGTAHEQVVRVRSIEGPLSARPFVPDTCDMAALGEAAAACRGCRLHGPATQVVFGEGPSDAALVLVGEQPGDEEDLAGRPFVGPAGHVLDAALSAAGIDRRSVYLTNAVKHFSFEPRGKRRIHQTPRLSEIRACRPWLEAEIQAIRPATIVCLGSTPARTLVGPQARVMEIRGRVIEGLAWAPRTIVTVHPSAVLRSGDDGERLFHMLVRDLRLAAGGKQD